MEGHREQAISSQFVFLQAFKRQEYMDSYPSWTEASFHHFIHNNLEKFGVVYDMLRIL